MARRTMSEMQVAFIELLKYINKSRPKLNLTGISREVNSRLLENDRVSLPTVIQWVNKLISCGAILRTSDNHLEFPDSRLDSIHKMTTTLFSKANGRKDKWAIVANIFGLTKERGVINIKKSDQIIPEVIATVEAEIVDTQTTVLSQEIRKRLDEFAHMKEDLLRLEASLIGDMRARVDEIRKEIASIEAYASGIICDNCRIMRARITSDRIDIQRAADRLREAQSRAIERVKTGETAVIVAGRE